MTYQTCNRAVVVCVCWQRQLHENNITLTNTYVYSYNHEADTKHALFVAAFVVVNAQQGRFGFGYICNGENSSSCTE